MPGLSHGADKALQLCQLPSMLRHENTLKASEETVKQREGAEQNQTTHPPRFVPLVPMAGPNTHRTHAAPQLDVAETNEA